MKYVNLDYILSVKYTRTVDDSNCIINTYNIYYNMYVIK